LSSSLLFDGRVAIVTGAGRGLGRGYAALLAERGAIVVVNDLGTQPDGTGSPSSDLAEEVAADIRAAGGIAIADTNNIGTEAGCRACVDRTVSEFGRLDVVVNNAGINPESVFETTPTELLERVWAVHVGGSWWLTQAAWPYLAASGAGRVIMTLSAAMYEGFGNRPTYALAKSALFGLVRDLAGHGSSHGIKVNGLFPGAVTRMVGRPIPAQWTPDAVAPVVALLAHTSCPLTGEMIETRGGEVRRVFMAITPGITADPAELTAEVVLARLGDIVTPAGARAAPMTNGSTPIDTGVSSVEPARLS
jgi:NAD(P)-dependent dehydrogenase (short-subunit alcohol dehydrogenase family)